MSRILVIGCGNVGSVGLHKMAQFPEVFSDIHIVSRTLAKCESVRNSILHKTDGTVNLNIHIGNVGDQVFLITLLNEVKPELVVNWGSPYDNLVVMDTCLEYGVNYIDTACYENPEHYGFSYEKQLAKDESFKKANLLAITGAGFDPGVTNILFLLPPLVIHLLYYLNDKRKTVEINKETGAICFISNDINECFSRDDIKSIDISINNGFRSPLKGYYYAKITLKNGKYKMVSCLTVTDLSHFPFITQKDELLFPMITNNENWTF